MVGTNGKGTACYYLEALYQAEGRHTGVFTSPHLMEIGERFRTGLRPGDYQSLIGCYHDLAGRIDKKLFAGLSFFELTFLIACRLFEKEQADVGF